MTTTGQLKFRTITDPAANQMKGVAIGDTLDRNPVVWQAYAKRRAFGGAIIGGPASGRSTMAEHVAATIHEEGCTKVWHAGPIENAKDPLNKRLAWTTQRLDNVKAMLIEAIKLIEARRGKLNRPFTPTKAAPGLMIILDDAHYLTSDYHLVNSLEEVIRTGDRLGVAVVMVLPDASMNSFGSRAVYDALSRQNLIVLGDVPVTDQLAVTGKRFRDTDAVGHVIDAVTKTATPFYNPF